jgi:hypothetical protein
MLERVRLFMGLSPAEAHDIDEKALGEAMAAGDVLRQLVTLWSKGDYLLAV